jgi:hypothetical protein
LVAICADALGCRVEDVGPRRLLEVKQLVVDALLGSRAVDGAGVGILIDEDLGAEQARRAHGARASRSDADRSERCGHLQAGVR